MPVQTKGFLRSLFDVKFDSLVTPRVMRWFYVFWVSVIAVGYVIATILAFHQSSAFGAITLLVIGPIGFLGDVVLLRMFFELVIALFKISENTSRLAGASTASSMAGPPGSARQPGRVTRIPVTARTHA